MNKKIEHVTIEKLVPGGQGLGRHEDGRVCFVWGALPGEEVTFEVSKKKSKFYEGRLEEVLSNKSKYRVDPKDEAYLSTSPWQTMTFDFEQNQKHELIQESFRQARVELPDFEVKTDGVEWAYRNKMEYSFWWVPETDEVELSFFQRGGRIRTPVQDSALALPEINQAAKNIRNQVNKLGILAKNLKTIMLRSNAIGEVVGSLYVKDKLDVFADLDASEFKGLEIWYSNPKSPASVRTELLHSFGEVSLSDAILDREFRYDVHSFFQVNLPVYEQALSDIKEAVNEQKVVDMFSGTGTIGLSVATQPQLVELDDASVAWAVKNAGASADIIHAAAESALECIVQGRVLILDPPRAGLHKDVIARIAKVKPKKIIYLSCDAATHARDTALLLEAGYKLSEFKSYNFFPKTPHTETLAILES